MADWLIKIFDTAQWSHQCWQWALLEVLPLLERRRQVTFATFLNSSGARATQILTSAESFDGLQQTITDVLWLWMLMSGDFTSVKREVFAHRLTLMMIEKQCLMWKRQRATWNSSDMLCIVKHTSFFVMCVGVCIPANIPPSKALNITSTFLFVLHIGMTHSWLHHNSMGHAGVMWQVCENSMKATDWQAFRRMCTVLTKLCFIMCNNLACPPLRNDLQRSKRDYWQHLLLLSDEDFICFCNYNNPS